ncbi:cisplatin, partial [Aphelenchoides avenae]
PITHGNENRFQIRVFTSARRNAELKPSDEIARIDNLDIDQEQEQTVKVRLPEKVRNNGSLFVHAVLTPAGYKGEHVQGARWHVIRSAAITAYQLPKADTFKLVSDDVSGSNATKQKRDTARPVTHFRSVLPLAIMEDAPAFHVRKVPPEIMNYLDVRQEGARRHYLPVFKIEEMSFRLNDLVEVQPESETVELKVRYRPISLGKFRLLVNMQMTLQQFVAYGFTEKDLDEVKGIFTDTNFYFLALTVAVATVHLLLDFLSFKNDVSFWRGRKTMVGVSTKTLLWRFFSEIVIFLYLVDQNSSLLIIVPAGIGVLVEFWKITKALKVHVIFANGIPRIWLGAPNEDEVRTENFDSEAMKYLAILLTPLCIGGALYSLLYVPHKSWWSWGIQCLANGVYAFGFLFMLPQLFINYKLKSVAHLPWRAFMYKAFNTFIDDIFAFIITMPTAHRMACFRDDVVFLIYLYQRWLYPVDRTRVNEYGEAFDEPPKKAEKVVDSKEQSEEKEKPKKQKKEE